VSLRYDSSTFLVRASPGLDEGKGVMGMVEKGMVKRFVSTPLENVTPE
jgi:hypothetical protein